MACLVDAARLAVYAGHLSAPGVADNLPLLLAGWMLLALAGLLATGIV